MIKVAMVTDFPLDFNKIRGGISALVYYLAKEFSENEEINLHIIACLKEVKRKIVRKIGKVNVHFLPSSRLPFLLSTFTIRKWRIRKVIRNIKPDIVHLQGQSYHSYPALNSGYLTLMTVHGIMYEEVKFLKRSLFKWLRSYLYKSMEKKCLTNVNYLIFSNEYAYQKIEHLNKSKQFFLLRNPVDPVFFSLKRDPIKNRILYVGKIDPRKGLEYLLEAIKILSKNIELKLHIIGPLLRQDYKNKLLRIVSEDRIEHFVKFKGSISQEDLLEEYCQCHLLVLPSNEETSPMVIEQAMAAEVPVVATRAGGIPYLIEDNKTGILVEAKDSVSLANGILELLMSPSKCEFLTTNAKRYAIKNFHVKKVARQTKNIYKQLVNILTH